MPEKQLELSKRNAFFKDPFFQDMVPGVDNNLEKRLAEFSAKSMGLSGAALGEAAHNIQVSASNDKFMIQLELPGFAPEDFSLKTKDDIIIIEAVHNAKSEDGSSDSRKFTKEFKMPGGVVTDQLSSTYSGTGILTISAPRVISAPEGAQVSEAMKAQSQAFVTDDGVAVKKDDKASSQSIAATTQSEDGSTISSFKSSSSSSSSSTMMSSGGPMPPMMGGMGMGGMPSMMGGMGDMKSLGMDDMMSKMMGNMKMGGGMDMMSSNMGSNMGSNMSKMSSSSFSSSSSSSFSSSSSSSMMSSDMSSLMGGGMPPMRGMQMPQMPGFDMPGLSFKEMPDMPAASPAPSQPEYTVTSPPMSPPPEMNHKVQKTEDYVPPANTQTAEATVLLKVKEGDEYKLALNMQQYSPEDITIKLNGQELTIEATNGGEQFKQSHVIPDNINLDGMSSSFSSDGVLVVKAPKK